MRMSAFRVQNYKKINDTGWVRTGQMTAFVGKNESGKSAVFRGLSKLNPSDGEKYDGLREFPRRRYSAEFDQKDWPVATAVFELEPDEIGSLVQISPIFKQTARVRVSRHYSGNLHVVYDPKIARYRIDRDEFKAKLDSWRSAISKMRHSRHASELGPLKTTLLEAVKNTSDSVQRSSQVSQDHLTTLQDQISSAANAEWQQRLLAGITDEIDQLRSGFQTNDHLRRADAFIRERMPTFLYFDRYDVMDSAINIDEFINKLANHPDDPRLRITECLFEHAGLDIDHIRELDPTDSEAAAGELQRMADERHIRLSSAAASMTSEFAKWWEQRKHKFHYEIDGLSFRVWVSDDLDPSEVELDQRSAGMQYFFSFFLVFLTESKALHENSILLLDEPGLQFHGTAQQKTVEFLRKLSGENQLLYTTHSPFMIDADCLEDVRIVTESRGDYGTTKVSDDVWPRDPDALFPLQAGLGYNMAQSLFYSSRQVIVEGITDYMYLKAVSSRLAGLSRPHLDRGIAISPAGGTRNMMRLASLLLSNDIRIAAALDGDQAGLQARKNLEKIAPDLVIVDEMTGKKKSEIEDMFDEEFYLDAVKATYPKTALDFSADEKKTASIVRRTAALFERKGEEFDKYEVCTTVLGMLHGKGGPSSQAGGSLARFEKLFKRLNGLCGAPTRRPSSARSPGAAAGPQGATPP